MTLPQTSAPADPPAELNLPVQGGLNAPSTEPGESSEVGPSPQVSPPPTEPALVLRSLRPIYVDDQHQTYVELLETEILKKGPEAPRNIALTGHYGSGKSSVLTQTQQVLKKRGIEVVNLSLPSLGIGDGRIKEDGDKARDKTNLIQKEIVKQLLYRRKPSATPASRYNRLDSFHTGRALGSAAAVGLAATGFAFIIGVPAKVRDAAPAEFWAWIDVNIGNASGLIQWLSLVIVFALAMWASIWVQRLLQQRIRISELGAGPAKVTLSDSASSFFDEYLDEIVYFFQISKTTVVIFEDLDRFKDPHIFETLRELNALLNNADQTGRKPIQFIYAIRDSIFEQLDAAERRSEDTEEPTVPAPPDVADTRRLTATNRTKFFDLVIPMVPFISHRTSRDLIRQQLRSIAEDRRPGNDVVDIVAVHLTDMRLIKNICNEYEIFQRRILAVGGLRELTPDRLFASIVYKNLYLTDYEQIRDGESALDTMYGAYREWVEFHMAAARTSERRARMQLGRIDEMASRSAKAGERLQAMLGAVLFSNGRTQYASITGNGASYRWADLTTEEFWRQLVSSKSQLTITDGQNPYHPSAIEFEGVEKIVGYPLAPSDWNAEARSDLLAQLKSASAELRTVQRASISNAITAERRLFPYDGTERSFADVVEALFVDAKVVQDLLRAGHIDENFTLYVTQFPGQAITAKAMNFILKAVQPDAMNLEYQFSENGESGIVSIQSVIGAEGPRLIGGNAVFNIDIFDYLLAANSRDLDDPIRRLASAAVDPKFLDAYMISGKLGANLIQRLSGVWPAVFNYVLGADLGDRLPEMLSAALGGVNADVRYNMNSVDGDALTQALPSLSIVRSPLSRDRAVAISKTVKRMGIQFDTLGNVAQPLLDEVVARSIYPVTLANLVAIYGDRDQVALDLMKTAGKPEVYSHVLNHLDAYLVAVDGATDVSSVADPAEFVAVLRDIGSSDIGSLEVVARKASEQCLVSNIDDLDVSCWPAIARAERFAPNAHNVSQYIAQYDLDEDLGLFLAAAGRIDVPAGRTTLLEQLALQIVNAETLQPETALQLLSSLPLEPGSITAADLREERQVMLPALVKGGAVADTSDAYASLGTDQWDIKQQLIAASANFPNYMVDLAFTVDDLFHITSDPVSDEVMAVLLTEIERFAPNLGRNAAAAIASWALNKGREPGGETIALLAARGGPAAAPPIVRMLGAEASSIDVEHLKSSLNALGTPFNQVTSLGWERPRLDAGDGVREVLTRLQSEGIVSSFEKDSRRQKYKVNKKRSAS